MTSSIVKCGTCNVVISELLAFVQNKADVMDEESIIRLCSSTFSEEEITEAKMLLFEAVGTSRSRRLIKRKKEGKNLRNIEDIIAAIKEIDPEALPIYVARNLQKLPPVTFDHIDASRLLKDVIKLQNDVAVIKETYATKEMLLVKTRNENVNCKRGANLMDSFNYDSGPIGLPHIPSYQPINQEMSELTEPSNTISKKINTFIDIANDTVVANSLFESSVVSQRAETATTVSTNAGATASGSAAPSAVECMHRDCEAPNDTTVSNSDNKPVSESLLPAPPVRFDRECKTLSEIVQNGQWKAEKPKEDWITVQRRRLRNQFIGKTDSKRDHCNKTVEIYEDVSSPPVTAENFGRPLTCTYRFRAFRGSPKDWILRIRFKKFKVGTLINGTTCHKGYMQIVDGNAKTDVSNRKEPGLFCGEIEQPQTFISETNFVKIVFHADNFTDQTYFSFDSRAEQQFEVYLRYGQHPELYPNRRGEVVAGSYCERVFRDCRLQTCYVQSAAYPGVYPRNLHCRYHLNTRLPYIKLYIENEEFNIDGQRCENIMTCPMRPITSGSENCPYDYIKIYDGKDESASVIGTFCGMGKFPYSIIGTSQDLFVEFVSSPAGPLLNTGFHFNVGNWPGHVEAPGSKVGTCDWVLTAESLKASGDTEGIFLSVAHWYPPHTSCTYLMKGFPGQVVRLYFPSFRINRIESPIVPWTGDCGESLTLYDAPRPDDARIIKTFCDTFSRPMEKHDFVSTGNAMFVRFESKTGSYSGSSLYYWAHYDFFNNTRFGEPVQGTACDEVIASWKQRAGRLRSPLNTLVYKQAPPGEDVHCLYRFVTDKRIYARVILTILSVNFKEHPYTPVSCQNCYEDRADKLIIWEPFPGGKSPNTTLGVTTTPLPLHLAVQRSLGSCLCAKHANTVSRARPYRVVSSGETLNLQLIVDNAHAAASYFKNPSPLFEARYEFVHGPLCGPPVLAAASDGEIVYPHLEALGYTEPPKKIQCIWDLEIEEKRDMWLHFDSIKFSSRHCEDGNIQIYLPGRIEPFLSVCGGNVSEVEKLPILSAGELGFEALDDPLVMEKDKTRSIRIVFIGSASPARAAFKIAWTGLYHLPKNSDGTLMTSKLTDSGSKPSESGHGCDFICPGEDALCIPARLMCNGVVNCPNVTGSERKFWTAEEKRAREAYSEDSLRRLGYLDALDGIPLGQLNDESPELCAGARSAVGGDWTAPALGAGLAFLLGVGALLAVWRLCCRKRSPDEESLDY